MTVTIFKAETITITNIGSKSQIILLVLMKGLCCLLRWELQNSASWSAFEWYLYPLGRNSLQLWFLGLFRLGSRMYKTTTSSRVEHDCSIFNQFIYEFHMLRLNDYREWDVKDCFCVWKEDLFIYQCCNMGCARLQGNKVTGRVCFLNKPQANYSNTAVDDSFIEWLWRLT